ncbi:SH3 domain-containing protein [Halomonas sp. HP20-15]|uniref:SH3 domain-containing protein n=1 Tax=Halomonas sp. HP20-15 TaxID=3085901 RepID=UPI0029820188|nr:SH3 domain-containing protein [Halomonas sp. HP20-15]MDW5375365.1 SH3 domain-containing protein [Halomonas sp. HP20-15]
MKTQVLKTYRSAYPSPIAFEEGDVVCLGDIDDEYPGWVRVTTADGNTGWAPLKYLELSGPKAAIANTGYSAKERNAEAGELVEALKQLDGWAWCLNIRGQYGWLPTAVLKHA